MSVRVGFVPRPREPGQGIAVCAFRYFRGRSDGSRLVSIGYQRFRAVDLVALKQADLIPVRATIVGWLSLDDDIPAYLAETCLPTIRVLGRRHTHRVRKRSHRAGVGAP